MTRDPPTKPPIQKQAKSPQIPESRIHPGCETLTISAGADAAGRALRPRSKLAWFYSAPLAGFYSVVDSLTRVWQYARRGTAMKREIIRVEPLATFLDKYKAPTSTVTKHGDTIYVTGAPPFDPETGRSSQEPSSARPNSCWSR